MTEPQPEGPIAVAPVEPPDAADPVAANEQLVQRMNEMAEAALLNLRGARIEVERHIVQIQERVASGEASAEMLVPLQREVDKARETEQAIVKGVAEINSKAERLRAEMKKDNAKRQQDIKTMKEEASAATANRTPDESVQEPTG